MFLPLVAIFFITSFVMTILGAYYIKDDEEAKGEFLIVIAFLLILSSFFMYEQEVRQKYPIHETEQTIKLKEAQNEKP